MRIKQRRLTVSYIQMISVYYSTQKYIAILSIKVTTCSFGAPRSKLLLGFSKNMVALKALLKPKSKTKQKKPPSSFMVSLEEKTLYIVSRISYCSMQI